MDIFSSSWEIDLYFQTHVSFTIATIILVKFTLTCSSISFYNTDMRRQASGQAKSEIDSYAKMADQGRSDFCVDFTMSLCTLRLNKR